MRLTLRTDEQALLREAMRSLLTPLAHRDSTAWAEAVCKSVRQLTRVDSVVAIMQGPDAPVIVGDGALSGAALCNYLAAWHHRIPGDDRRRSQRLTHWVRSTVWPRSQLTKTSYYNEYCVPFGNRDSAGMSATADGSDDMVVFLSSEKEDRFKAGGRERAVLALLQPALAAGAPWSRQMGVAAANPDAVCDSPTRLSSIGFIGIALLSIEGRMLHATPRLADLLGDKRLPHELVLGAMRALVRDMRQLLERRSMMGFIRPVKELETPCGRLTMTPSIVERSMGVPALSCAIEVTCTSEPSVTAARLRFGLTRREAEVASLLAAGRRNREIADQLGMSEHTARRHTERIFSKLHVSSRATVAAMLAGDIPDTAADRRRDAK